MRVVSLLPSATEICYALGVEPVAVSHECDHPPAARKRPSVTESRVANAGSSETVNDQVAAAEEEGVFGLDLDVLRRVDPDLLVAQGVCDVCAVDGSLARRAVEDGGLGADVLSLHSHTLEGALGEIETLGERLDRADLAGDLLDGLRERIEAVRDVTDDGAPRPRVAVLDWMDPPMVAGHWVPELVEHAGGRYGLADAGDRSTVREWSDIRAYDPEVLVVAPCGFGLERTLAHVDELTERPGWTDLAAVEAGRVHAMDGHHYLNRTGPRLVEALEYLAGVVRPDRVEGPPDTAVRGVPRPERPAD